MTYAQRHCPKKEIGGTVKCMNVYHWVWEHSHSDLQLQSHQMSLWTSSETKAQDGITTHDEATGLVI